MTETSQLGQNILAYLEDNKQEMGDGKYLQLMDELKVLYDAKHPDPIYREIIVPEMVPVFPPSPEHGEFVISANDEVAARMLRTTPNIQNLFTFVYARAPCLQLISGSPSMNLLSNYSFQFYVSEYLNKTKHILIAEGNKWHLMEMERPSHWTPYWETTLALYSPINAYNTRICISNDIYATYKGWGPIFTSKIPSLGPDGMTSVLLERPGAMELVEQKIGSHLL